jgi:hypothetical protein
MQAGRSSIADATNSSIAQWLSHWGGGLGTIIVLSCDKAERCRSSRWKEMKQRMDPAERETVKRVTEKLERE